jgi:hypothetical protein
MARNLLLQAVRTVEDGGEPPGIQEAANYLRAGESVIPQGASWLDEMRPFLFMLEEPSELIV